MDLTLQTTIIDVLTALFSGGAAYFWLRSALIRLPELQGEGYDTEEEKKADMVGTHATIKRQSFWSALGATSAGLAAATQFIGVLVGG